MSNDPSFDQQQKEDAEKAEQVGAHVETDAAVQQADDREDQTWTVYRDAEGKEHRVHSETFARLVAKGEV